MANGNGARPPAPAQRQAIRRRRTWAGLVVVLCVAADLWSVSWAGADEPMPEGAVSRASRYALTAGTAPAVSIDQIERVPEATTDSPTGGTGGTSTGSSTGSTRGRATATGDGKNAKGAVIEAGSGRFTVVPMPAAALRPMPTTGRTV